jgi:predicted enzyme related to lactoylglutathione lyase
VSFAYVATLDCADPERLAEFWAAALHYRANPYDPPYLTLTDPQRMSPELILQKVPEPKHGKNRMHLDLFGPDIEREAWRMESLGARRLSTEPLTGSTGNRWIVMADPEGNEFCVCEGDITTFEKTSEQGQAVPKPDPPVNRTRVVDATFGSLPRLRIPSRDDWA